MDRNLSGHVAWIPGDIGWKPRSAACIKSGIGHGSGGSRATRVETRLRWNYSGVGSPLGERTDLAGLAGLANESAGSEEVEGYNMISSPKVFWLSGCIRKRSKAPPSESLPS